MKRLITTVALLTLSSSAFIALPVAQAAQHTMPAGIMTKHTAHGVILTNAHGMTLYTFGRDTNGHSMCNGRCASIWRPVRPEAGAMPTGNWTLVTRANGMEQWAYDGKPLYTYSKDEKPGDMKGNGLFHNMWRVAMMPAE